jgi:hypothetical protein
MLLARPSPGEGANGKDRENLYGWVIVAILPWSLL